MFGVWSATVLRGALTPTLLFEHLTRRIMNIYKVAALQYKRIESTTRSPIYNFSGETMSGIATIRAFQVRRSYLSERCPGM